MPARSLFGSDRSIRRGLLTLAQSYNWQLRNYEQVSAPLADKIGWRTHHGIISFVVSPAPVPLIMHIGLRPV